MASRLVLWRHAKSAYPLGVADLDRPLSERGVRDALATRDHLARFCDGVRIRVLVSPARRTLETWAWAGCALDACDVEVRSDLYLASREQIVQEIAREHDEVDVVVVLAHDPGLHELVIALSGSSPLAHDVRSKFPTSAMAMFAMDGSWTDVDRRADLREIVVPRG